MPDKGKILFVDDPEVILRNISGNMLNCIGYKIEFAKDGTDAITMYEKAKEAGRPFDAIILVLSAQSGLEAKKTIQKLKDIDSEVKGIISTGYSDIHFMTDFGKHGFNVNKARKYNLEELGNTLDKIIKEKRKDMGEYYLYA